MELQVKPKKDINIAIQELDQEMHTFLQARLEMQDFNDFQDKLDQYLALTSILIQLASNQDRQIIDVSEID